MEDLVSFLKAKLSREGITPYQLSQKTSISRDYLSRLLNGKIVQPGIDKLQKIGHVLNFELSDLPPTHKAQPENHQTLPTPITPLPCNASDIKTIATSTKSQPFTQSWVKASNTLSGTLSVPIMNIVGRSHELSTLEQWIVNEQTRVISLWGLAGIGKTTVASAMPIFPRLEKCFNISIATLVS
jgi:transcriptional regulator with XRE-family HTH domain